MSQNKEDGLTVAFNLTRRLFSDDAATATVEAELDAANDAVLPSERAMVAVARPLLALSTPLVMFASMCVSFVAAHRLSDSPASIVFVFAAVVLPFILAWPARALRRSAKRKLLQAVVARTRARLTVDTRAIFASPAVTHDELFVVPEPATVTEHTVDHTVR